ncbi:uncharacterized protein involved in exopolysaccharide biosynthesis [Mycobacterium sp. MAA66]|uniref:YveK family protein n=1 Tax=Mycobacterium sp. MAA66 TaxID=3156297 RepID=UPI00351973BC
MDGQSFLQLLRTRWSLVAVGLMLGLIGGTTVALLTPIKFSSTAEVLLRTPGWAAITSGDVADSSPYSANEFAQERAKTYANLLSAPGFSGRLVENSHLQRDPSELSSDLSGRVIPDTVLIEVTATDRTATGAHELATATADELVNEIRALETPAGARIATIDPVLTSPATVPRNASDPDVAFILIIGGAAGFLAGITAATLMTDRRRATAAIHTSDGSSE